MPENGWHATRYRKYANHQMSLRKLKLLRCCLSIEKNLFQRQAEKLRYSPPPPFFSKPVVNCTNYTQALSAMFIQVLNNLERISFNSTIEK